ncbi:hypothetical protein GGS21DRAFT_28236 [Xylaria nigripes]|nr:hypothetical protein GGS21DRAFT_28236 [Xylaria nigripes]
MPRRDEFPSDRKDKLVQILSLFLLLLGTLTVLIRLGTKYVLKRGFRLDDKLVVLAEVTLIAQTVTIILGASQGLGRAETSLSEQAIDNILKAEYASIPLLLAALSIIKWSLLELIYHLSPNLTHQRVSLVIAVLVAIWLVSGVSTSLFQCALPTPWDHRTKESHCFDRKAWWTYVVAVNVTTELGIVSLYFSILRPLQVSLIRKTVVLAVFSARLLVVVAAIIQLVAFHRAEDQTSGGVTYSLWFPTLFNQVLAAVSVVTACLPYLKPFMESVELDIIEIREEVYTLGESDYEHRPGDDILVRREVNVSSVDCVCRDSNRTF